MKPIPQAIRRRGKRLLLIPPILVGVGVFWLANRSRRTPEPQTLAETARTLSYVPVICRDVRPTVLAYGLAQPARLWQAVARVEGTVVETHPRLEAGELIDQAALLLRIDPTDYQLEVERLDAESKSVRAQLEELQRSRENDQATLEVELESLELARNDLERVRQLLQSNAASQSEYDRARRDYLNAKRNVQTLRNSLNLIPPRRQQAEAKLESLEKQLAKARRDLEWTSIQAPFDGRLAEVRIEPGQYVSLNERLFEVHGTNRVEVEAKVPLDEVLTLVTSGSDRPRDATASTEASPAAEGSDPADAAETAETMADQLGRDQAPALDQLLQGLRATVRVQSGDWTRTWPATITRIGARVDRRTRTVGVVVTIDSQAEAPVPLLEGTFCQVALRGAPRRDALLVPLTAIRDGSVYLVDDQSRLDRRPVNREVTVGDFAVVRGDLQAGDRVIVTDPSPAAEGMLVDPVKADWDGLNPPPDLTAGPRRVTPDEVAGRSSADTASPPPR